MRRVVLAEAVVEPVPTNCSPEAPSDEPVDVTHDQQRIQRCRAGPTRERAVTRTVAATIASFSFVAAPSAGRL